MGISLPAMEKVGEIEGEFAKLVVEQCELFSSVYLYCEDVM